MKWKQISRYDTVPLKSALPAACEDPLTYLFRLQWICIILHTFLVSSLSELYYITHVSFEAPTSGFAVVLTYDTTSHGIRKSQSVLSNSLQKELSNDIWFAYIVLTHVSGS